MSSGDIYDDRWRRMTAAGKWPHGEADLVCWFNPTSVLDAGCGAGRVAIELDRRGIQVVGVDRDSEMLATARSKAPHLTWIHADLVDVTFDDSVVDSDDSVADSNTTEANVPRRHHKRCEFDVVVMAGNVMIFVTSGTEAAVLANMAGYLKTGGRLVAGFQLVRGRLTFDDYEELASESGLTIEHRWSTWEREPYIGGDYSVFVHRML